MSAAKALLALFSSALVATGAPAPAAKAAGTRQNDRNAFEVLARTMRPTLKVNVVAFTLQRDSAGENTFQKVKLIRSKTGKQRWTVLAPVRLMGIDSVDDGVRRRLYLPDLRQISDMESSAKAMGDYRTRIELAKKNYTFEIASRPLVAGRKTLCVTATPKNSELEVRRFYIDAETDYPLRVESVDDEGKTTLMFETQDVRYPKDLDASVFTMSVLPGVKVFTYNPPVTMNKSQAKAKVGFVPLVPAGLPMGFKVQALQYNDNPSWKSVMVRLTDGLTQATVYQWMPNGNEMRTWADSTSGEYNGIKLLVVSNQLGPTVRAKLLQAFINQAIAELPKPMVAVTSR